MKMKLLISIFLPFFLLACGEKKETGPEPQTAPSTSTVSQGEEKSSREMASGKSGMISGKVIFKGNWKQITLKITKDKNACGETKQDPSLVVSGTGEVQNAVVYIANVSNADKPKPQKVTLEQKGCEYHPHVLAFPVGSTVEILNPDGILHNVHSYSQVNSPFNLAMPKFKKSLTVELAKPEIIQVKCDVHDWMSGWFFVANNSYFSVTDKGGNFKLDAVPAGEHDLEVWHEKLGKLNKKVTVEAGKISEVTFELTQ